MAGTLSVQKIQGLASSATPTTVEVSSGHKLYAPGHVIQVVNNTTTAVNNLGDVVIPYDDTIPQNTEGGEVMTLAITPISASSKLLIDVIVNHSTTLSGEKVVTALFQDSNANALACSCGEHYDSVYMNTEVLKHYMTAGTTSATTFKVRIGRTDSHSNPFTINGYDGARKFGGVSSTSITIMEIAQ